MTDFIKFCLKNSDLYCNSSINNIGPDRVKFETALMEMFVIYINTKSVNSSDYESLISIVRETFPEWNFDKLLISGKSKGQWRSFSL